MGVETVELYRLDLIPYWLNSSEPVNGEIKTQLRTLAGHPSMFGRFYYQEGWVSSISATICVCVTAESWVTQGARGLIKKIISHSSLIAHTRPRGILWLLLLIWNKGPALMSDEVIAESRAYLNWTGSPQRTNQLQSMKKYCCSELDVVASLRI